ncbi:MAG: hypothetical protein M0R74_01185 [Dehalococcoidia bacterium]|nr:hypothetical protein [Dehalococcoidia bacterium]
MATRRLQFGAFRGLALGLTLSVVNLLGVFLTIVAFGGLGEWTRAQFAGLFGLIEVATGAAFVIGPNIWRLAHSHPRCSSWRSSCASPRSGFPWSSPAPGVARPGLDVYEIVVKRPRHEDYALPAVSLGAAVVQLLLNIGSLPAVKLLPPDVLYQPEMAPSAELLAWSGLVSFGLLALGFLAWWGRVGWQAPRPQQREADEYAA